MAVYTCKAALLLLLLPPPPFCTSVPCHGIRPTVVPVNEAFCFDLTAKRDGSFGGPARDKKECSLELNRPQQIRYYCVPSSQTVRLFMFLRLLPELT